MPKATAYSRRMYNRSRKGTWAKLRYPRSGWGAWVDGIPNLFEGVILETRDGKMTLATVDEIIKPCGPSGGRSLVEIGETTRITELLEDTEDETAGMTPEEIDAYNDAIEAAQDEEDEEMEWDADYSMERMPYG